MTTSIITQSELKEILNYDPKTGLFRWRIFRCPTAKKDQIAGCKNTNGYIVIRLNGKLLYAHRLAFLYIIGRFPNEHTDHINHIKNDNSWSNLREVTRLENMRNMPLQKNNTSGNTGVYFDSRYKTWQVRIGDSKYAGSYKTKKEAIAVRKQAEIDNDHYSGQ